MRRIVAAFLLLAPLGALAQEEEEAAPLSTNSKDDRKVEKFAQVEHGFYLGVESGLHLLLKPSGNALDANGNAVGAGLATGQSVGVEVGFEPVPFVSLGLLAVGTNAGTSATYYGTQSISSATSSTPTVTGNISALMIGANARGNLSLGEDSNGQRRTFLYLRAGLGYTLVRPAGIVANGLSFFGGPGIEYFTRLRHFSLGAEVLANVGPAGFALIAQPVVRYSF